MTKTILITIQMREDGKITQVSPSKAVELVGGRKADFVAGNPPAPVEEKKEKKETPNKEEK